jgi:hypothetical protein
MILLSELVGACLNRWQRCHPGCEVWKNPPNRSSRDLFGDKKRNRSSRVCFLLNLGSFLSWMIDCAGIKMVIWPKARLLAQGPVILAQPRHGTARLRLCPCRPGPTAVQCLGCYLGTLVRHGLARSLGMQSRLILNHM